MTDSNNLTFDLLKMYPGPLSLRDALELQKMYADIDARVLQLLLSLHEEESSRIELSEETQQSIYDCFEIQKQILKMTEHLPMPSMN